LAYSLAVDVNYISPAFDALNLFWLEVEEQGGCGFGDEAS
jgi:hypothetical protein